MLGKAKGGGNPLARFFSNMTKHLSPVDNSELEALELAQTFADETGIDVTEGRPCIARLFYEGVAGGGIGRKPSAFIVALELKVAGLPIVAISKHLEAFNGRCSPPMGQNILASVLRSVQKTYDKRYGCDKLQAFCIGERCPFKSNSGPNLSGQVPIVL